MSSRPLLIDNNLRPIEMVGEHLDRSRFEADLQPTPPARWPPDPAG